LYARSGSGIPFMRFSAQLGVCAGKTSARPTNANIPNEFFRLSDGFEKARKPIVFY